MAAAFKGAGFGRAALEDHLRERDSIWGLYSVVIRIVQGYMIYVYIHIQGVNKDSGIES